MTLYVDIPTLREVGALNQVRSDACVSISLKTTPLTQEIGASRITLGNLVKQAIGQLETAGLDKRRIWPLQEHFDQLLEDDDFWEYQANSLVILATPERIRTYRLANELTDAVEVSDRFDLKALLRAITFPHAAHVLAISENAVRLVQVSSDLPAIEIPVPNMPSDAASAVGKASINDSGTGRRLEGLIGQKVRLGIYLRKVEAALRPILQASDMPVVLAATQPVEPLLRAQSTIEFLPQSIETSPDRMSDAELAAAARPILDKHYQSEVEDFHRLFEERAGQSRATSEFSTAARAATFGGIESLLINIDSVVDGLIDDETGAVTFASESDATGYCLVDEIAGRALRSGASVLAVRQADIPANKELAAILRYPV